LNLDESHLYEMLVLELFQSGLSWSTVLHKRDNFKAAFKNWQISEVAKMTDKDIDSLMQNKGIIRNRMKINAAVKNARAFLTIELIYCSVAKYFQNFVTIPF